MNEQLPRFLEVLRTERFYGETVLKWEAGQVTLVRLNQDLKEAGLRARTERL